MNADINGARVELKRFQSKQNTGYKSLYKGIVLGKIKFNFIKGIESLLANGKVGRRGLYKLILKNKYFSKDLKEIEIFNTTEASGIKPMTAENYIEILIDFYSNDSKIKTIL